MNRTPQQQQAIETTAPHVCVDAGAGSGKTSVLIARILHLLETRAATLDEIVAITFTDAAATEMKIRLRKEFRKRAPVDDPGEMSRWRAMERWLEFARISSIHSFCAGLVRENALRIGLDPDFAVLPEAEAALLRIDSVTQCIHRLLNEGDPQAVHAGAEFGVAGLISRIDALLVKGLLMDDVARRFPLHDAGLLAATWQRLNAEAHDDALRALAQGRQLRAIRAELAAFDGACIKASDGREVARLQMLHLLDVIAGQQDTAAIAAALEEIGALGFTSHRAANWPQPEQLEALKAVQETLRKLAKGYAPAVVDSEVEQAAAGLTCGVYHVYEACASEYASAKRTRAAMDFDDLLARALHVLREDADVRERTARDIRHLLIDEFQDTDSTQLAIARLLADVPGGPHIFIVGDAKQSIYDFRGAEVELFQNERKSAQELIRLQKNFRTLPDVLEFVNDFFSRSEALEAVEPRYAPLEAHRPPVGDPRVEFLLPEDDGVKRNVETMRDEEARLIAARIEECCREGAAPCVWDGAAFRRACYGDIAILFRSMTSLYTYEEVLRRWAIPFHAVGGAGFYARQEVVDLRNLMTLLVDPLDEPALFGFLRGPFAMLSDDDLAALAWDTGLMAGWRNAHPPAALNAGTLERLEQARALLDSLRVQMARPLPDFLRTLLDRTGYEAILLSQFLGVQKAQNIRKLLALAEDFGRTRQPSLPAFIHYLELLAREEFRENDAAVESGGSAVTLMTIHKSKGLEFPIVFVPDVSRKGKDGESGSVTLHRTFGITASITGRDGKSVAPAIHEAIKRARKEKGRAESARILYVAMTRARDVLILSGGPAGDANTWMAQIDAQHDLLGRADGDVITGDRWAMRIRRKPVRAPQRAVRPVAAAAVSIAALARQAARIEPVPGTRRLFSISELLDQLYPRDAEEPQEDIDEQARDRIGRTPTGDAMYRGTLVHRMFEQWRLPEEPPIARILEQEFLTPAEQAARAADLEAVAAQFRQSPLAARFEQAGTAAQRECPFMLRIGDALVNGVIDIVFPEGVLIDYKTGRPNPQALPRYEMQLRLYTIALHRLCGVSPSGAALYYVDSGRIHDVDVSDGLLTAALNQAEKAIAAMCRVVAKAPAVARGTAFAAE